MTEPRDGGHEWVTQCDNPDCGGSCFVCCCGYCKLCGLAEGATTTDCPKVQVYTTHADRIYAGEIDYRDGQWVNECSPHSPEFYRKKTNVENL
jgi:hypothetical protein